MTATVRDGHVAAWWPDAPTTEAQENARTAHEIRGRDRDVVERLYARSTEKAADFLRFAESQTAG